MANEIVPNEIARLLAKRKQDIDNVKLEMAQVVEQNPALKNTSTISRLLMVAQVMSMGLQTDKVAGEVAFIPYGQEVQLQIQSKGMVRLTKQRNPDIKSINVMSVRKSQENQKISDIVKFDVNDLTMSEKIALDKEPVVSYLAWIEKEDGTLLTHSMTKEQIEEHAAKYSKTWNTNGPWKSSFDAMAKKTVIKALIRDQGKVQNLQVDRDILLYDQAAFNDKGDIVYVDNPMAGEIRSEPLSDEAFAALKEFFISEYKRGFPPNENTDLKVYNQEFTHALARIVPAVSKLRTATDTVINEMKQRWTKWINDEMTAIDQARIEQEQYLGAGEPINE